MTNKPRREDVSKCTDEERLLAALEKIAVAVRNLSFLATGTCVVTLACLLLVVVGFWLRKTWGL